MGKLSNRGPGKEGKKAVTAFFSPEEYEKIKLVAERDCRSIPAQVLWYVRRGMIGEV